MVIYSVFVPIYNEEGNIIQLFEEIKDAMNSISKSWELILINDGSSDKSLEEMRELPSWVRIIDLQKNYGQAVAMDVGFRESRGEYIISLDGDLQNDPKDIPRLIAKLKKENLDVVAGWRKKRKDPMWMLIITKTAKFLRGFLASDVVNDSGCTLRVYKRKFVKDLELWGEMHRYIMAILQWRGAKISDLAVNHRARIHGVSKYNWKKSFKGLVDLAYVWFLKKFSSRPLHLFGITGIFLGSLGFVTGLWSVYLKIFRSVSISDSAWAVLSSFLVIVGIQFFIFGIILDLLIRIQQKTGLEKRYKYEELRRK